MEHEILKRDVSLTDDDGFSGRASCACGWTTDVGPFASSIRCDLALETAIALHLDKVREDGGLARWPRR